jgi:2-polyprenyl-3-methyl-5-hydroxy-6-metoxy-1,4-benzoquinol methylase
MISANVLAREQEHFDREAGALDDQALRMSHTMMARYAAARPTVGNTPKDQLFALLRPLAGKRVLDYGCGSGENACLLAHCGADVTAFDLSPMSIGQARRRAEISGVADRIQFDVRAAGQTGYPDGSFDVIVGEAILHHLHMDLATIYAELARLLRPGGVAGFIEPVANSRFLAWLRARIPVHSNVSPDERQLRYADFAPLQDHGFQVEFTHFLCLERLHRFVSNGWARRLRRCDAHLLRAFPFLRRCYGTLLIVARKPEAALRIGPA